MFTVAISVVATVKESLVALTATTVQIVVLDFEFGHQSSGIVIRTDVSLVVKALHGLGYSNLIS